MSKKIVIELNNKSIENAIKQLKDYKSKVVKATNEFLEFVSEWVIKKANIYIDASDIGDLVKLELRNSWDYTIKNGVATVSNNGSMVKNRYVVGEDGNSKIEKQEIPVAILVEFGVGVVGQSNPHPNASVEGYKYNLPTIHKNSDGMWYFWTNSNELDIPLSAVEDIRGFDDFRGVGNEQGKRIVVGTRGTQGVMYAYNAIVDAQMDLQNPNGQLATEWKRLKVRYGLA